MITPQNTAILILTCSDFEALDLTLNQVLRTTPDHVNIYLLSNCAGLPGAEVCEQISKIAARAQYGRIHWINPGTRQHAYFGISAAIRSQIPQEYILKLDDDVFPIREGWFEDMVSCYAHNEGPDLAYVSGLVNNNPWGFSQLIQMPGLRESYQKAMPFAHMAGEYIPGYQDFRTVKPGAADSGGWGTIWQFPQLARWIHTETTLQPKRYIALTKGLTDVDFDPHTRYSINVMLFKRDLWDDFGDGGSDDEEMLNRYCEARNKRIVIRRDVPFVHLYFGPQRRFLVDMLDEIRAVYRPLDQVAGAELVADWGVFRAYSVEEHVKKKI